MLIRRIYFTLLLISILWGQNRDQGDGPAWLFSLVTPDDVVLAIGHSPLYLKDSTAYANARLSGSLKLAYQFVVHLEYKHLGVISSDASRAIRFLETLTDNDVWDRIQQSFTVLDSAVTSEGVYVLLAISRDLDHPEVDTQSLAPYLKNSARKRVKTPNWMFNLMSSESLAVGFATGEGNIGDNEYVAMKDAIVSIATARSSKLKAFISTVMNNYGSNFKFVTESITDETVHGARVVERWYDRDSKYYYALVSTE